MPANDKYNEVLIFTVVGIIVFVVISVLIIFILLFYQKKRFQHKKQVLEMERQYREQLLQSQLETQEFAFNQISEELHDNIGQLLSSTKMLLSIGMIELQTVPDAIKTAEQTVAKAIQDLRSLSKSLNREWLDQFNLIENLETEKERINAARNIEVTINSAYQKLPLKPESQVMLFRVVQEALQNSIRHASPKHINIQIKNTDHHFELTIQDDGKGFDINSAKKESLGLRNMEHRVHLLGGTIAWQSEADKGTLIAIKIPVSENV
jgi:signal transduction histidine kinase